MALDIIAVIQYSLMFCVCMFFSAVAIDRKTILTNLIAAFAWMATGLINFIVGASGFGSSISLFFWVIGFVFVGAFMHQIIESYWANRQRWNPL